MDKKTGGQAFPVSRNIDLEGHIIESFEGMTLRDWFAGQALCGQMAQEAAFDNPKKAAGWAYGFADAMLEQREK